MLSGVGSLCLKTKDYEDENFIFPGKFVEFSISADVTSKEAFAWAGGKKQVVSSAIDTESYTLTISSDFVDWVTLGWAFDEVPGSSTNALVPITKAAVTDSSGQITDPDIPASPKPFCFVNSRGSWGEAHAIEPSKVTASAGSITLSEYPNAPITYHFEKSFANIETIGVESEAKQYGKLAFSGVGYGPEFPKGVVIVVPEITRNSSPSLATDDVPRLTVEYSANVPPGFIKPFRFYNLATVSAG